MSSFFYVVAVVDFPSSTRQILVCSKSSRDMEWCEKWLTVTRWESVTRVVWIFSKIHTKSNKWAIPFICFANAIKTIINESLGEWTVSLQKWNKTKQNKISKPDYAKLHENSNLRTLWAPVRKITRFHIEFIRRKLCLLNVLSFYI